MIAAKAYQIKRNILVFEKLCGSKPEFVVIDYFNAQCLATEIFEMTGQYCKISETCYLGDYFDIPIFIVPFLSEGKTNFKCIKDDIIIDFILEDEKIIKFYEKG